MFMRKPGMARMGYIFPSPCLRRVGGKKASQKRFRTTLNSAEGRFNIMDEKVSFQRYQTVYERLIRYPDGRRVSFDVFGAPASDFKSVFIFPFNTKTRTATLLREYAPGPNALLWGFPAGGFDPKKHTSLEDAARAELSEEAFLTGGILYPLTEETGVSQDKYSRNVFHMYLMLDPVQDENPLPRDDEEHIDVVPGVSLEEVRKILGRGEMNVCSSFCGYRALDALSRPTKELRALLGKEV